MSLDIVYEDKRLLAAAKPAGRLVIPGRGEEDGATLQDAVSEHIGRKAYLIHRIDRATSGLVLFAKDKEAQRKVSFLFEGRKIEKTYHAVVLGEVEDNGTVDEPLRVFGSGRTGVAPDGKPAVTHYKVRQRLKGATYLVVTIETGRRHQIRAHLNHIGHPVLGDPRYGPNRPVGGVKRLMLHAYSAAFKWNGKDLRVSVPPPEDFLAELALWEAA